MSTGDVTDQELAELIERNRQAAAALINGDIREYVRLISHGDDYTLMPPTGGQARRGFDDSEEAIGALERYFRGGEADVEVVATYASGDLVVLVVVERQHGEVGELPPQDLSLRVTMVFRRQGSDWLQVHRHADPLVHEISQDQLAVLARSQGSG